MEDTRTFQQKSFQANMDAFLEKLDNLEFYQLTNFLNTTFYDTEPNEIQAEFIDEFFGNKDWDGFINDYRGTANKYIMSNGWVHVNEVLSKVREYISFRLSHRFIDLLKEKADLALEVSNLKVERCIDDLKTIKGDVKTLALKTELLDAIEDSKFDGVFDKMDGWCNVSDVLVRHNLITLEED